MYAYVGINRIDSETKGKTLAPYCLGAYVQK